MNVNPVYGVRRVQCLRKKGLKVKTQREGGRSLISLIIL